MNTVIKVENLWKEYRLGVLDHGVLYKDLQSWWARIRGKRDPHLRIGQEIDTNAEDRFWALKDINFSIKAGESIAIIGKNGAGKSTLLKILSRVTVPTKGSVKIKGRVASLLEVGTGFHQELTGRENIFLNGAILGLNKQEIRQKFDEIVDFSGVEKFIDTPVKRYSSGMTVRLAFAVAAHLDPDILIVDEVLAVGDAEFQKKCIGKMGEVGKEGRTVIFVSHNMTAVKKLCPTSILLKSGSIVSQGETEVIVDSYLQEESSGHNLPEIEFPLDEKKKLQILKARLVDQNGKTTNTFDVEYPVYLKFNMHVRQKEPKRSANLHIYRNDGTLALVSSSNDLSSNLLDRLKTGENLLTLTIPARSLGIGSYTVHISFLDVGRNALHSPGAILDFHLYDSKLPQIGYRGFSSAAVPWVVESNK